MDYFWVTVQIVMGVLTPAFLFYLVRLLANAAVAVRRHYEEKNIERDIINPGDHHHWFFVESSACPNPAYISLTFRNTKTKHTLNLSIEKTRLKAAV